MSDSFFKLPSVNDFANSLRTQADLSTWDQYTQRLTDELKLGEVVNTRQRHKDQTGKKFMDMDNTNLDPTSNTVLNQYNINLREGSSLLDFKTCFNFLEGKKDSVLCVDFENVSHRSWEGAINKIATLAETHEPPFSDQYGDSEQ